MRWVSFWYTTLQTRSLSTVRAHRAYAPYISNVRIDIRTWHANIEQHASEGVNKILIGNKSDWSEKRVVSEEQGRALAEELGIKFIETSARVNDHVEEAFFTLARFVGCPLLCDPRNSP